MTTEEAIQYALSGEYVPRSSARVTPAGVLTDREREVASLVREGLTNRRIASKLNLSERTVEAHVRKVLKKLGLRSRSQIAAWAVEREVLPKHK